MRNDALVKDYVLRAKARVKALAVLEAEGAHADVVRESQEVVELALKALLRASRIEVPRVHDVSPLLVEHAARLPDAARQHLDELVSASRSLRRDRELAFYGSEDLTPSEFYGPADSAEARKLAARVVEIVSAAV